MLLSEYIEILRAHLVAHGDYLVVDAFGGEPNTPQLLKYHGGESPPAYVFALEA